MSNDSFARRLRRQRLSQHSPHGLLVVPLDHSVTSGPIVRYGGLNGLVAQLAANDVDAVVLHKGAVRHVDPAAFVHTSLVLHLSASTVHAADPDAKYLVAGVDEAVRLGADAVSVHVNLGSAQEAQQVADLAAVAEACDRWNMPLLAMMYPRGPHIDDPTDSALVAHAVVLAADLGADLVKTNAPVPLADLVDITQTAPVPVLVAGGAPTPRVDDLLDEVDEAMGHGAAGAAIGRRIFAAPDPGATAKRVADAIHRRAVADLPARPEPLEAVRG